QAAIAEGGTTALNFLRAAGSQTAAIGQEAIVYVEQHPAESGTLAGATGRAAIQYTVRGAAGAAGEGTAAATGATVGETTVAAGGAIAETTVAAGAVAETTVA